MQLARLLANKYVACIRETHCSIWSSQQIDNVKHVLGQEQRGWGWQRSTKQK